jgi:hypothetical protein
VQVADDELVDPFAGDPEDPAAQLDHLDDAEGPLTVEDREEILSDLSDLEVFRTLLEPRGTRGLVVDCEDCEEPHYFDWALLMGNLRHLLQYGTTRVHEPAFEPDAANYVSWDYAHGYCDGVLEAAEGAETEPPGR